MAVDGHIAAGAVISAAGLDLLNPHFVEAWVGDDADDHVRSTKTGRVYAVHRTTSRPLDGEWKAQYRAKVEAWLADQDKGPTIVMGPLP